MTQETAESQSNLVVLNTLEERRKSIRCSFRYDVRMSTPRYTTNMRTIPGRRRKSEHYTTVARVF